MIFQVQIYFIDLQIKRNDCQLQHLTRHTLMNRVDKIFKKSFNDVRQAIRRIVNNGGYVCTTADVWTGGSRRFLGVTVSWVSIINFMILWYERKA